MLIVVPQILNGRKFSTLTLLFVSYTCRVRIVTTDISCLRMSIKRWGFCVWSFNWHRVHEFVQVKKWFKVMKHIFFLYHLLLLRNWLSIHFQVSKYWSFYMLEMLWCAQEPWYPYIKGNCSQITFYYIVLTIIIKHKRQLVAYSHMWYDIYWRNLLHIVVQLTKERFLASC